jgi:hypothetical protein
LPLARWQRLALNWSSILFALDDLIHAGAVFADDAADLLKRQTALLARLEGFLTLPSRRLYLALISLLGGSDGLFCSVHCANL